jgi:hypothetical protein
MPRSVRASLTAVGGSNPAQLREGAKQKSDCEGKEALLIRRSDAWSTDKAAA